MSSFSIHLATRYLFCLPPSISLNAPPPLPSNQLISHTFSWAFMSKCFSLTIFSFIIADNNREHVSVSWWWETAPAHNPKGLPNHLHKLQVLATPHILLSLNLHVAHHWIQCLIRLVLLMHLPHKSSFAVTMYEWTGLKLFADVLIFSLWSCGPACT